MDATEALATQNATYVPALSEGDRASQTGPGLHLACGEAAMGAAQSVSPS